MKITHQFIDGNKIKWGIIGCGDVTEVKSGPALQKIKGSELVAVMRRDSALAQDYARRHHVKKWFDDANALIHDPDLNAIYIATPPSSHKDYTLAAAEAGKPVYVEKPMALNFTECQEMIAACQKHEVPLFVAYYRRELPRFVKIKNLLDEKAIGKVQFINMMFYKTPDARDIRGEKHWRVDPKIAGGGYFFDLAPHLLDLLHFYFGQIKEASGSVSNQGGLYNAEDMISALLLFESGIHATMIWNFHAYENLDRVELVGSEGKITFSIFANKPIQLETKTGIAQYDLKHPEHIQQLFIQTVVDELLGKGRCPGSAESAAETNRVMDQIYKR